MQGTKKTPIRLVLASGSTENKIVSSSKKLDTSYDKVLGGAVYENTGAGVPYQIQIKDVQGTIIDFISSKDFISNNASNHPNEKYFPLSLEVNKSQEITLSVKPLSDTTQKLDIELVLILQRDTTNC